MGPCTGPLHFSGFFVPCINECVHVGFSHLAGIGFMCVVAFVIIDNIRLITLDIVMKSRNLGPFLFISAIVSQECQLRECITCFPMPQLPLCTLQRLFKRFSQGSFDILKLLPNMKPVQNTLERLAMGCHD